MTPCSLHLKQPHLCRLFFAMPFFVLGIWICVFFCQKTVEVIEKMHDSLGSCGKVYKHHLLWENSHKQRRFARQGTQGYLERGVFLTYSKTAGQPNYSIGPCFFPKEGQFGGNRGGDVSPKPPFCPRKCLIPPPPHTYIQQCTLEKVQNVAYKYFCQLAVFFCGQTYKMFFSEQVLRL